MLARLSILAGACAVGAALAQPVPAGYPADYAQTVAAAYKEGKVVVYSALDTKAAQPLIKDFQALYPGVKVEYNDMNSTEMYNRFIAEVASGQGSADVMWSSAMDLQVKLVDEGQAMTYASPEAGKLPGWAVYKNQAYGTTYEPAVFIYNKRLVAADEVPAGPRGVHEADLDQGRQVQGQGHDLRYREERCRLHVRRAGRQVLLRDEGSRARRSEQRATRSTRAPATCWRRSARASICSATTCSAPMRSCARRRILRSASCCRRITRLCSRG